jgi:hypothetical protein
MLSSVVVKRRVEITIFQKVVSVRDLLSGLSGPLELIDFRTSSAISLLTSRDFCDTWNCLRFLQSISLSSHPQKGKIGSSEPLPSFLPYMRVL